jgi:hypothetical protein
VLDASSRDGGLGDHMFVQEDAPPFIIEDGGDDAAGQEDAGAPDARADAPGDAALAQDGGQLDGGQPDAPPPQTDGGCVPGDGGGTCFPEPDESAGGNSCAAAIDKGTLSDVASAHLSIVGNIWPDCDVDWYKVHFEDSPDDAGGCDKFNVRIGFAQNPGTRYRFDVVLDDCAAVPTCTTGVTTGLTSFTWDDSGECPCVAVTTDPPNTTDGVHICTDHSVTLRVRVYRASGAAVCENYELTLDNG